MKYDAMNKLLCLQGLDNKVANLTSCFSGFRTC